MLEVDLTHRMGDFALNVTFAAPPGITALFGRSGAGKTTVVNAVAGLLRPDGGRIALNGRVMSGPGVFVPPHRRRIGYVFQDGRLFPHLSVRGNLTYGQRFAPKGGPDLAFVVDMLDIGPLLPRRPRDLSGGEKARVAMGRALLSNPQMLLMDEPLAALDEGRKMAILPYLERLRDDLGLPILYVSHALSEVARLATTLVMLEAGQVRQAGDVAALLADPDLAPAFGLRAAGAILPARIAEQGADGLTRLDTSAGTIWLPMVAGAVGTTLRLRIPAQDVMLSLTRPVGISALNVLPCTVTQVRLGDGPGAMVQLRAGDDLILARITQRSAHGLGLAPGLQVFAVVKSVAVARGDLGLSV